MVLKIKVSNTGSPEFMTPRQICAQLNIDQSTLFRWERKHLFVARIVVAGTVRYRRADVEAWLAKHTKVGV